MSRTRIVVLAAIALIAIAAVLWAVLQKGEATRTASDPTQETSSSQPTGEPAEVEPEEGDSKEPAYDWMPIITFEGGEPVENVQEIEVEAGDLVRFQVSSDVAEEIHVHGYDITKEVAAGGTREFEFPATIEGIFEIEMEQAGVQIAELQVNP